MPAQSLISCLSVNHNPQPTTPSRLSLIGKPFKIDISTAHITHIKPNSHIMFSPEKNYLRFVLPDTIKSEQQIRCRKFLLILQNSAIVANSLQKITHAT